MPVPLQPADSMDYFERQLKSSIRIKCCFWQENVLLNFAKRDPQVFKYLHENKSSEIEESDTVW